MRDIPVRNDAGLDSARIELLHADLRASHSRRCAHVVPPFVKRTLKANSKAWENFQNFAPSYRRNHVAWIMHAKQQETRERRLHQAIVLLKQNKKLGLR